jgi:acetyltransferase-like isoleucine patch superfamily enzyme
MKNVRSAGEGIGKNIIIEDGVWIGFGAIILPGVRIGYKSIIGAGAIVSKDIPPNSIAAGNPCKIIREYDPLKETWGDDVGL